MKKMFLTLLLIASSFALFAKGPVEPSASTNPTKEECSKTVTVTESRQVQCGEGIFITVSATRTSTKIRLKCEDAESAAWIEASIEAYIAVEGTVQSLDYICS